MTGDILGAVWLAATLLVVPILCSSPDRHGLIVAGALALISWGLWETAVKPKNSDLVITQECPHAG